MELIDIQSKVSYLKGQRDSLHSDRSRLKRDIREHKRQQEHRNKALTILKLVGVQTQMEAKKQIADLATTALQSILPDPFEVCIDFESKRNQTEVCTTVKRKGTENKIDPMTESGGGLVEIIAFALRISFLKLCKGHVDNVLIMDEPFRFVSKDLQPLLGEFLVKIAEQLSLQIIMITHERTVQETANKYFLVDQHNGISVITDGQSKEAPKQIQG